MSSRPEESEREPLLAPEEHPVPRLRRDSWAAEVPPGIIAYEREHSNLYETGAHWLQVRRDRCFSCGDRPLPTPHYLIVDYFSTLSAAARLGSLAFPS